MDEMKDREEQRLAKEAAEHYQRYISQRDSLEHVSILDRIGWFGVSVLSALAAFLIRITV